MIFPRLAADTTALRVPACRSQRRNQSVEFPRISHAHERQRSRSVPPLAEEVAVSRAGFGHFPECGASPAQVQRPAKRTVGDSLAALAVRCHPLQIGPTRLEPIVARLL